MAQAVRRTPSILLKDIVLTALSLAVSVAPARADLMIRTLAGLSPAGYVNATGTAAFFNGIAKVAVDASGNAYVADTYNCAIRKITPAGVVTTFAGAADRSCRSADGTGTSARFFWPSGIAIDGAGTLYVADTNNHTIRQITPAGVVTTIAGLAGNPGSTDGTGSAARFNSPAGIAADAGGTLYVADTFNHTIRKITPGGVVTTLAGLAGSPGPTDGTGSAARFRFPQGVAVDGAGTVYVADPGNVLIRQVTSAGVATTLAGTANAPGSADGTGAAARFSFPGGVAVDAAGTVYVADSGNNTVRQIATGAVVTTLAGTAGQFGPADGTGTAARFNGPTGIAVTSDGTLFVGDTGNSTLRKITAGAVVTTLAGYNGSFASTDGTGRGARFALPLGVAVDPSGNTYVADTRNSTIRKITPWGSVTTLAGLAGSTGSTDGTGSAARFFAPNGIAVDNVGTIYVADSANHIIRQVTAAGVVTTIAGTAGAPGNLDGTGSAARFNTPRAIAVDSAGTLYVADSNNHTIRRIAAGGVVTTLAGAPGASGWVDATGNAARFSNPLGVTVDNAGTVFVGDSGNNSIRQITSAGAVTTLAGNGPSSGGFLDGTGTAARFSRPAGIAVNSTGTLYVGDTGNNAIREIAPGAIVSTVGGGFGLGSDDGSGGSFTQPVGVAVDGHNNVYVADSRNNTIRTSAPFRYTIGDFDNDGKADLTIFRPGSGTWFIDKSASGYTSYQTITWGNSTDIPVSGDFDGDGIRDVAIFRPSTGTWWVKTSSSNYTAYFSVNFGVSGDVPFAWDVDGDRIADLVIYRPSTGTWWATYSSVGYALYEHFNWGIAGDIPVPGEYAGTNGPQVAVYRPSTGEWWTVDNETGNPIRFVWGGMAGDVPVPFDYDGDGLLDLGIYRPSTGEWWIKTSSSNYASYVHYVWGNSTDIVVPADYDGDGKTDVAVYRPSTGEWWVLKSSSNFTTYSRFVWGGTAGDKPVTWP
jgi:hypothetical protein